MEKTAVEWLEEQIKWRTNISDIIIQAKEMEKEQAERMYSEEEKELMIKIFHSYWFENNPEHEDNLKEWELSKKLFEQFKKK
jgi:hypothetical protein